MQGLEGSRILIVEDQPVIAMAIEAALDDMGAVVAGMASSLGEALALASTAEADAALLDLWLGDVASYSVGDILAQRGIPFVIISGASTEEEPAAVRKAPRLVKPFKDEQLRAALMAL